MKSQIVPFWLWNKRKSPMTMTPKRVASGKAPFNQRVLQELCGVSLYRKLANGMRKQSRAKREAAIWEQK